MNGDDSFNEADDSFFNLYSTQKVTSRYHDLLEKLKTTAKSPDGEVVDDEKAEGDHEKLDDHCDRKSKKSKNDEVTEVILSDDSPSLSPTSEESISVRRSTRVRRCQVRNCGGSNSTSSAYNTRSRKKNGPGARGKGKRKGQAQDVEVVELDECDSDNTSVNDDDVNYEVSVKVFWKSVTVKTFQLRRYQKLMSIFQHFKDEENVPVEKILLSLNNRKISPNDTPESLDLKVYDFIEGGVLTDSSSITSNANVVNGKCTNNEDNITIKVQDKAKNIMKFSIGRNDPLKSFMIRYAEQIETPLNKIKFSLDGEILSSLDTPVSLGLDDDEIIDVKITA